MTDTQNSTKRRLWLRPDELPDTYAMAVEGDCLEPAIPNRSCLTFTTTETARAGDLAVLYRRPSAVPEGHHQALIKRMLTDKPVPCLHEDWDGVQLAHVVEMDNPRARLVLRAADIVGVHKCLGIVDPALKRVKLSDAELRLMHRARQAAPLMAAASAGARREARIAAPATTPPRGGSYPVLDKLPRGHAVMVVGPHTDGAPFFRRAEFAVIDTTDREPTDDGLFVAELGKAGDIHHSMSIVAPFRSKWRSPDGATGLWCHRSPDAPRSSAEREAMIEEKQRNCPPGMIPVFRNFISEGPFNPGQLEKLIRGRVVGTFGPTMIREAGR